MQLDTEVDPLMPQPAEVEKEYSEKATLAEESRDWLISQGVPESAIQDVTECTSGFVRQPDGSVKFLIDPDESLAAGCARAFHIPVLRAGVLVDLIRFLRTHPGAKIHGCRVCRRINFLGDPIRDANGMLQLTPVWSSPLSWLKAGRQGLVYWRLSWPSERTAILRELPAVQCEDVRYAKYVERMTWCDPSLHANMPLHWARYPDHFDD